MKKSCQKLTGELVWHGVVALDIAAHLCLTVFDLCHQIRLSGVSSITGTTAAYLFGGAPSFKSRRDLYARVQNLLRETGVLASDGPSLPPLEPVYIGALAELAIRFIERPHAAILIPQVIQDNIWCLLGAQGLPPREDKNALAAEKLAQDLLDFMKASAGVNWTPKL